MKKILSIDEVDLNNKRVIIREDLNVPLEQGKIADDTRIQRALPNIRYAIKQNARVLILSHLGRPEEGIFNATDSLQPVAKALSHALDQEVRCVDDWLEGVEIAPGQVVLAENVRFLMGEKKNDSALAKKMAEQCDVFVMDAFATAHRAQASTVGIAEYAPIVCAGLLLTAELKALNAALEDPQHPMVAVVGGSKVSTKIQVLENLLDKVDCLIVGGGIANTFLAAQGYPVGKSLYEADWVAKASELLVAAAEKNVTIPLPVDVAVATKFVKDAPATIKKANAVAEDEMILDVGSETAAGFKALMHDAGTIVWNGPVGVFEFENFGLGTRALGEAIAASSAFSIAGGGDTLNALALFHLSDKISYISTGGGAFLELLEGRTLPAVAILQQRA